MVRDITVFLKSPMVIIMSLAMPIVMMGMIGGNLMQNMAGGFATMRLLVYMMLPATLPSSEGARPRQHRNSRRRHHGLTVPLRNSPVGFRDGCVYLISLWSSFQIVIEVF